MNRIESERERERGNKRMNALQSAKVDGNLGSFKT